MEFRVVVASPMRVVVVPPTVSDAALMAPAPVNIALLFELLSFPSVMPLVTVRVAPVLTVKIPVRAPVSAKVIEFAAAFAVTVTVTPSLMRTPSPEPGMPTPQPVHVPGAFQLPVIAAVQVNAYADVTGKAASASMTITIAAAVLYKKDLVLDFAFIFLLDIFERAGGFQ